MLQRNALRVLIQGILGQFYLPPKIPCLGRFINVALDDILLFLQVSLRKKRLHFLFILTSAYILIDHPFVNAFVMH